MWEAPPSSRHPRLAAHDVGGLRWAERGDFYEGGLSAGAYVLILDRASLPTSAYVARITGEWPPAAPSSFGSTHVRHTG